MSGTERSNEVSIAVESIDTGVYVLVFANK